MVFLQILCRHVSFFGVLVVKWTKDLSDLTILEMLDALNARVVALHEKQLRIAAGLAEAKEQMAETRNLFRDLLEVPKKAPRSAKRHPKKKQQPARKVKTRPAPAPSPDESRAGKRQVLGKSLAQLRAGSKRPAVTSRLLRSTAAGEH